MDFDDEKHEPALGSMERVTFSDDDPREKSLLRLIEERGVKVDQNGASDDCESPADDVDKEDRLRFDHQALRLGANGF